MKHNKQILQSGGTPANFSVIPLKKNSIVVLMVNMACENVLANLISCPSSCLDVILVPLS